MAMTTALGSPLADLVRGALADLGAGPGVLADWLEENGDARGVLLRRRWKRWQIARRRWEARWGDCKPGPGWIDNHFHDYIRCRFPEAAPA